MSWEDDLAKIKGADLRVSFEPAQKPEERSNMSRGFETAMRQIPQTIGGALGLLGDVVGADAVRNFGMDVYEGQDKKIKALQKDSDSFSRVLEGEAGLGDWLGYGVGYVGGQALTALGTGGLGGLVGKEIVKRRLAKEVGEEAAKKAVTRGAVIGATAATGGLNLTQEAGSIYPEAVEQAQKEGRELDAGDKVRVVGSAFAAAAVDTAVQFATAKALGLTGAQNLKPGQVPDGLGMRVAKQVPVGMAREGVTEGIQTGIERYGAGKALTGDEATHEYIDSMALGALGGGMAGAASSLRAQKQPEVGPSTVALNAGTEATAKELDKVASNVQAAQNDAALRPAVQPMVDALKAKAGVDPVPQTEIPAANAMPVPPVDVLDDALAKMERGSARDLQDLRQFGARQSNDPIGASSAPIGVPTSPSGGESLAMQNRDRSRPASVAQMQAIAANPDYDRLGFGRGVDDAAPMVSVAGNAKTIPDSDFGQSDRVTLGGGLKVPVRYAVVEADSVQTSHRADGTERPEYYQEAQTGVIRALNNGRTAGVQEAYGRGTAEAYLKALKTDVAAHGVPIEAIEGKKQPMLVRVYDDIENLRPNIGALSNADTKLGMASSEQAFNDARIIDVSDAVLDDGTDLSSPANRDVLVRFAKAIQAQGGDLSKFASREGSYTPDFIRRVKNAVFAKAYQSRELVEALADDHDPDLKNVFKALEIAAPSFARIDDAKDLDIRPNLNEAVASLRDAKSRGMRSEEYFAQQDWLGRDEMSDALLRFMWNNARSPKRIGAGLKALAEFTEQELQGRESGDMFGREDADIVAITERVNEHIEREFGPEASTIQQNGQSYEASGRGTPDGGGRQQDQNQRAKAESKLDDKPKSVQSADDFALETYDRADLERRQAASEKAVKTSLDDSPGSFVLSGSARDVDELEARGQGSLFEGRATAWDQSLTGLVNSFAKKVSANRQAIEAVKGSLTDVAKAIRKGSVLASIFGDKLIAKERADILGAKVRSPEDLAFVSQVLRDPRFETFRWVFVKNGVVVGTTAISSRLASSTNTLVGKTAKERKTFEARMKVLAAQADGYYMMHNHPNGDPAPSDTDALTTKETAAKVPGFLGHVVIDTNAYSVIDATGKSTLVNKDFGASPIDRKGLFARKVDSAHAVAQLAGELKKPGWATLIAASADLEVNGVLELPMQAFENPNDTRLKAVISRFGRSQGAGGGVFVSGIEGDAMRLAPLIEAGMLVEVVDVDGRSLRRAGVEPKKNPQLLGRSKWGTRVVEQRMALDFEAQVSLLGLSGQKYQESIFVEDENKTVTLKTEFGLAGKDLDERLDAIEQLARCL